VKTALASFGVGALFSAGLVLSGMTQPAKVVGFLDVTGDWDPSLAFVMGGALLTYAFLLPLLTKRLDRPVFGTRFQIPTRRDITGRLVGGSVLFGLGWGLGGYCPGPAIASTPTASSSIVLFLPAMLLGMFAVHLWDRRKATATVGPVQHTTPMSVPKAKLGLAGTKECVDCG